MLNIDDGRIFIEREDSVEKSNFFLYMGEGVPRWTRKAQCILGV